MHLFHSLLKGKQALSQFHQNINLGYLRKIGMKQLQKSFVILGAVFCLLLSGNNVFAQNIYKIDRSHSSIGFAVKHLMISTTRGEFTDFTGEIQFDPENLSSFSADIVIKTKSIDTRNEKRDGHLRNSDFFDVEKYPTLRFKGKQLVKNGDGYDLTGNLTIKAVTKEITIPVTIAGPIQRKDGEVIGLSGEIIINRQDYGVSWSKTMDQGGLMVDNNVKIIIELEAHKQ